MLTHHVRRDLSDQPRIDRVALNVMAREGRASRELPVFLTSRSNHWRYEREAGVCEE